MNVTKPLPQLSATADDIWRVLFALANSVAFRLTTYKGIDEL
jgi:hypothetical protein